MSEIVTSTFITDPDYIAPLDYSFTTLFDRGGYHGTPLTANPVTGNVYEGYLGVQTVNAPNISVMEQVQIWVSRNPILTVGLGIGTLLLLKGRR